jgi:trk system potassium uptake protein TrkH
MKAIIHPARAVALAFLAAILAGTLLLMLPQAHSAGLGAPLGVAFFTAVSAVCVTGMAVVDTGTYWTTFGQGAIMLLFQLGGFGMMTAATLLGLMVNRSTRLRTRLMTQTETRTIGLGDVSSVAKVVLVAALVSQAVLAVILAVRLRFGHGLGWEDAGWSGLFHAASAFNNAGFSIHADSLTRYAGDAFMLVPMMLAIVVGGIGFPVLHDLRLR